ncbi:hypothetical protein ACFL2D_00815 [Patescibacteria group bacterium]
MNKNQKPQSTDTPKKKFNAKYIAPIAALAILAGGSTVTTLAMAGDEDGKNAFSETRDAIREALSNRDYATWQELTADKPIGEQVNEENFDRFADAHDLMNEARGIMDELGIERGPGKGQGGPDKPRMSEEDKAAFEQAVTDRDYAAWTELMDGKPISDQITEENFDRFAEAVELKMSGDHEGAKAIMDELGIEPPHGKGEGRGQGGHGMGHEKGQGSGAGPMAGGSTEEI